MTPARFDLATSPLEGTRLIEASAGTGKTFAIAGLFLRLVLERELPVSRILVVTFTVAATQELRDRVRRRLAAAEAFLACGGEDALVAAALERGVARERAARLLRAALRDFDEASIFTIHGFCQRSLAENAFESGADFDAELVADPAPLLAEVVDDYWRRRFCAGSPLVVRFALKSGLGPEGLLGLLRAAGRHPTAEILPAVGVGELAAAEERFTAAFERVCALWTAAGQEVAQTLAVHPGLSRSADHFRPDVLAACLEAVDACAGAPDAGAPPACYAALEKLSAGRLAEAVKKGRAPPAHPFFDACDELCRAEATLFLTLRADFLRAAAADLAAKKRAARVRGFDDLLAELAAALAGGAGEPLAEALRGRYAAALIDEFQDTDPLQYEIFARVFGGPGGTLFLIGDPKQAIYGFRGADVYAYLEASRASPSRSTLTRNWRSGPLLLAGVNRILGARDGAFVVPGIGFPEVGPAERVRDALAVEGEPEPLRLWFVPRTAENAWRGRITKKWANRALPAAVAAEVARLLGLSARGGARIGERPLAPGDVAVLVRTNDQAKRVQEALATLGVPSVARGTESVFASPEAAELERLLAAVAAPGDEVLLKAALATSALGVTGSELYRLADDEGGWERWLERFAAYHELWRRHGFLPMFRRLLGELAVRERLLALPLGERRLTNWLQLAEVLHRAAAGEGLGPTALAAWLATRRGEPAASAEEHELRLETDDEAVQVVTVHRSKGLEYPVVFCPFSWEGSELREDGPALLAHPPDRGGRAVLDLGSPLLPTLRSQAEVESLAENVRLLYVALTRARNRCYLVWGAFHSFETSAPAWLLHAGSAPASLAALRAEVGAKDDAALLAELAALGPPSFSLSDLPEASGVRWSPPAAERGEPRCRVFGGRLESDWGLASFTSLAAGAPAEDAADRDRLRRPAPAAASDPSRGALGLPGGAKTGVCLHEILELADLAAEGTPATGPLVAAKLAEHGFDPAWQGPLEELLERVRAVAPGPGAAPFGRIPRRDRRHEVGFTVPLRAGEGQGPVTAGGLAAVFARTGAPLPALEPGRLPERLGRLAFSPVRGYLRGFMDLVAASGGRYFLVDWKTNRLGERSEDYGAGALAAAMTDDLYVLQYHLYAVAIHLHLAARLPGYRYDEHFGGVCYVFLRGLDPARPEFGVFRDRPTRERLEGLANYLTGGGP